MERKQVSLRMDYDLSIEKDKRMMEGEVFSDIINNLYRGYVNIKEDNEKIKLTGELKIVEIEKSKIDIKVALLKTKIRSIEEEEDKENKTRNDKQLKEVIAANKSIQASGILHDLR